MTPPLIVTDLAPDLLLLSGRIHTLDAESRVAQAVAIKDGRVLAVGAGVDIERLAGPTTQRLDLGGRTAIPGLFDSHNHFLQAGLKLAMLRLDECRSPADMAELVRQRSQTTRPGEWIVGHGWNEGRFPGGRLPTRYDLDPATAEHPVLLMRTFNLDVVNSYALRLAGLDRHTPDPLGGSIDRAEDGTPTGLVRGDAKVLIRRLISQPSEAELRQALRLACHDAHRFGITSIIDPGLYPWQMRAYQALYQMGELSVRANVMPSWYGLYADETESELQDRATNLGLHSGLGDEWLRLGALKMGLDGGITTRTAYMYEPYEDTTDLVGSSRLDEASLLRHLRTAQEFGWDVGIHCCGDRAQDMAADALAAVARERPRDDARHSIIHGYFPSPRALTTMAEHQIAAVIQPPFLYWQGDLVARDVGERRAQRYKPARTYLDHGVMVVASSDVTTAPSANPFPGLYALVTRKNRLGQVMGPAEALDREQALRAYTMAGAWLTREERLKGTIEVGRVADLAVLDRDYFAAPDDELKDIQVEMTIVGGRVVWEHDRDPAGGMSRAPEPGIARKAAR